MNAPTSATTIKPRMSWVGRRPFLISVIMVSTRPTLRIDGTPYCLLWSPPTAPGHLVCIEPWHSLPDFDATGTAWETFAPAAQLAPGETWGTTLVTEYWC